MDGDGHRSLLQTLWGLWMALKEPTSVRARICDHKEFKFPKCLFAGSNRLNWPASLPVQRVLFFFFF